VNKFADNVQVFLTMTKCLIWKYYSRDALDKVQLGLVADAGQLGRHFRTRGICSRQRRLGRRYAEVFLWGAV